MLWKSAFEKSAVCCLSSRFCITTLPNLPLSAEKPLSERFLWKYSDRKSTGEAIIRVKISAQAPILLMFLLGIKNKETVLSTILITFLMLKYLSKRMDFMLLQHVWAYWTLCKKHPTQRPERHHSQHTFQLLDQSEKRNEQTFFHTC